MHTIINIALILASIALFLWMWFHPDNFTKLREILRRNWRKEALIAEHKF